MSYIAEQNVIGSLLIDGDSISKITNDLPADAFTSELLGRIYLEFQKAFDNNYTLTIPFIVQSLSQFFPQDIVLATIKECTVVTQTSATIKAYAQVVISEYKYRKVSDVISHIKLLPSSIDDQIGQLMSDLEAIKGQKSNQAKTLPVIVKENKGKYFTESAQDKIYVGFTKLDDILGGLEGGDVIVIGARPAVGKSALVTQITSNIAKQGKKVGFYNLEMQEKQVYERFIVSQSGISLTRLKRAVSYLGDEKERFDKANEALESRQNIVISTGSKTVSEIRTEVRHMGYDVLIIDYLQLVKSDTSYKGSRYAEVGAISKAIKALSMELNIPIIALSQLNRVSEMRETKEPTMAELREAGDIEQDASTIILLWNVDNDNKNQKGCKVEKHRQGKTGKVYMEFDGDLMQFRECGEWRKEDKDDCPFD